MNQTPRSASGLLIVIGLHGAAITALALSKMEVATFDPGRLKTYNVPVRTPPPPQPVDEPQPRKLQESVIETVPPRVPTPLLSENVVDKLPDTPSIRTDPLVGIDPPALPEPPKAIPIRVDAEMLPQSELQPPYPPSEQRIDREGSVAIRLLIGTDGRVKAAERVRAASDAFYRATERHALRHWRFRPATLDGKPVESWKTLTVHFRLS